MQTQATLAAVEVMRNDWILDTVEGRVNMIYQRRMSGVRGLEEDTKA